MGTDMSRIEWHNQFDLWWPWKFQVNKRNLWYGISLKWWDLHYTLFVSIEEYYELAYCLSRESMKTLAFFHPGSRNSRKQQYLPILRAKAFKSCWRYCYAISSLVYFGGSTHKGLNDFFSPKLFKPRRRFFYTSKYGTWRFFRKKIKFFLHRLSRYSTPNMALQKIILTSFVFFLLLLLLLPDRGLCVLRDITPRRYWAIRNEISQTCSGVNVVVSGTFWVHSVQGVRS